MGLRFTCTDIYSWCWLQNEKVSQNLSDVFWVWMLCISIDYFLIFSLPWLFQALSTGWLNRRVAATSMNRESSRSHAVFTMCIESKVQCRQCLDLAIFTCTLGRDHVRAAFGQVPLSLSLSPWYNRNAWLGVKHQITYSPSTIEW